MALGKFLDFGDAVGYRAADGVVVFESLATLAARDFVNHLLEALERLGGLAIERYVAREIHLVEPFFVLHYNRLAIGLPHETVHFGVPALAVDNNLRTSAVAGIGCVDALLELEHHRAGGVDNLDVVLPRNAVCLRRLAVRPQEHFHIVQPAQVVVGDSL